MHLVLSKCRHLLVHLFDGRKLLSLSLILECLVTHLHKVISSQGLILKSHIRPKDDLNATISATFHPIEFSSRSTGDPLKAPSMEMLLLQLTTFPFFDMEMCEWAHPRIVHLEFVHSAKTSL